MTKKGDGKWMKTHAILIVDTIQYNRNAKIDPVPTNRLTTHQQIYHKIIRFYFYCHYYIA